ncbi:MAG TPA: conjugal transfer protein TrbL family protein [Candidatus Saccharimonadales bacterium]|nr:conjugal transfer protein TrbL family protein [Candidatus Saccharimonadales bacterium]
MIDAVNAASGATPVWDTLSGVVKQSGGQSVAALLIMVAFLILSVILLVYYIGRLVTLYIGAVLSPAVLLAWLVPGFRDFSETAAKTYITTIFVLFVHVVILQLAASLFVGMAAGSDNNLPDTLMAMVTGLATIVALLKTQGVMTQFSYVSGGARNARKLGGQFMNGVGYITGKGKAAAVAAAGATDTVQKGRAVTRVEKQANSTGQPQSATIRSKRSNAEISVQAKPNASRGKTGTTTIAPKEKPEPKVSKPAGRSEKN